VGLQQISLNALWNVSTIAASMVCGLVVTGAAVRELGLEQYGYFGLLTIILAPLAMGGLGFTEGLPKFIAGHTESGNIAAARKHVQMGLLVALIVGGVGAALMILLAPNILQTVFSLPISNIDGLRIAIYWMTANWVIQQIGGVYLALAAGLQAYREVAIANFVSVVGSSLIQLFLLFNGYGLKGFVAGLAIGNFIGLVWLGLRIASVANWVVVRPKFDRFAWHNALHFGGWQTIGQVGGIFANQGERFLLGVYLSPALLGIYISVIRLEQAAYLITYKLSEVLFPFFSKQSGNEGDGDSIACLRAAWLTTLLGVSILIPMIPLGKALLVIWLGADVANQSGSLLVFLVIGGVVGCATNSTYFFMLGHGKTRFTAGLSLATGVTTVVFALIFLPYFGFMAAAWAGLVAMVIQAAMLSAAIKGYFTGKVNYVKILIWVYSPVIIGFTFAAIINLFDIQPTSLIFIIIYYLSFGVLVGAVNISISCLLPDGHIRWCDISRIYRFFKPSALLRK